MSSKKTRGERITAVAKRIEAKGVPYDDAWVQARPVVIAAERTAIEDDEVLADLASVLEKIDGKAPTAERLAAIRKALEGLAAAISKRVEIAAKAEGIGAARARRMRVVDGPMAGAILTMEDARPGSSPSKTELDGEYGATRIERAMSWLKRQGADGTSYHDHFMRAAQIAKDAK